MTLHPRTPREAGLPDDAFRETLQLLDSLVESRVFPGAALLVGYRGGIVLDAASGTQANVLDAESLLLAFSPLLSRALKEGRGILDENDQQLILRYLTQMP